MNVLWMMADQMRADFTGFLGSSWVKTPNLDRLAGRGTVFSNVFSQCPICTPSRTCIFTGRYVHAHGAWWNGFGPAQRFPLLPEALQASGYETVLVGKWHIYPQDAPHGFAHKELHEECLPSHLSAYEAFLAAHAAPAALPGAWTDWTNSRAETGVCQMPEEIEETRWVADRACDFLRGRAADAPFFLCASFIRPHSPYNPLAKYLGEYAAAEVSAPPFDPAEWDRLPPRIRAVAESWGFDRLSADEFAEARRHYAALCTQVDANAGRILDCLDAEGLADDTIVVFTSDHGDFLGEHGLLYKEHLWDGALHVPLIIHDPRRGPGRYDGLVESIDTMPTVLDLLGVPAPASVQGRSLVPAIESPGHTHRDAVFAEFSEYTVNPGVHDVLRTCREPRMLSVRTQQWKYIHYVDEPGELYDLQRDPGERLNLIDDTGHQATAGELRRRLLDWQTATPGYELPAPDNAYFAAYFGKAHPPPASKGTWD